MVIYKGIDTSPSGGPGVLVTSGAGAWVWGAFSADLIAAGQVDHRIGMYTIVLMNPSVKSFELILYVGASDTEVIHVCGSCDGIKCLIIPANHTTIGTNERVRAKMMDDSGGKSAYVKLTYSNEETHGYRDA